LSSAASVFGQGHRSGEQVTAIDDAGEALVDFASKVGAVVFEGELLLHLLADAMTLGLVEDMPCFPLAFAMQPVEDAGAVAEEANDNRHAAGGVLD
jgi:hypothetical protein